MIETEVSPSEGELDDTVGGVVSVVVVVELSEVEVVAASSLLLQDMTVKLKIMERIMRIYLKELPVSGLGIN